MWSASVTYRQRDAIAAFACWEACFVMAASLVSRFLVPRLYDYPGYIPRTLILLLVASLPCGVSIYLYDRLVQQRARTCGSPGPARVIVAPAVIWIASFAALDEVSYRIGLTYEINQLLWNVFGPAENLYGFYNLRLPRLLNHVVFVALPSWRLSMVAYRRLHRRVQSDQPVCPRCSYHLTGNVSGRCPECGKEVQVERPGT